MSDQSKAAGMEFITPMSVALSIDGKDLTITPLTLRELPNLLALSMPIFASLRPTPGFLDRMRDGAMTVEETSRLIAAITVNGDEFVGLMALCSRQSVEWAGSLLADRATVLATACLQVNADFFSKAMPTLLAAALQAGSKATQPANDSATQTASSSS